MDTVENLQLKLSILAEYCAKDKSTEIQNAFVKAEALMDEFKQGLINNAPEKVEQTSVQINAIIDSACMLMRHRAWKIEQFWPYLGMAVLAIVFGLLASFMYSYGNSVGLSRLATIDGARPLLVIAAIVSTIAFGGALLLGSLFSTEGTFEDRFRHAREIFLVFSGVFGTVIGFYFGASDPKSAKLTGGSMLEEKAVLAFATGGTGPYKLTLVYGIKGECSKSVDSKDGLARFNFENKGKVYLLGAKISAIDSKDLRGEFLISQSSGDLANGKWGTEDEKNLGCDLSSVK